MLQEKNMPIRSSGYLELLCYDGCLQKAKITQNRWKPTDVLLKVKNAFYHKSFLWTPVRNNIIFCLRFCVGCVVLENGSQRKSFFVDSFATIIKISLKTGDISGVPVFVHCASK